MVKCSAAAARVRTARCVCVRVCVAPGRVCIKVGEDKRGMAVSVSFHHLLPPLSSLSLSLYYPRSAAGSAV